MRGCAHLTVLILNTSGDDSATFTSVVEDDGVSSVNTSRPSSRVGPLSPTPSGARGDSPHATPGSVTGGHHPFSNLGRQSGLGHGSGVPSIGRPSGTPMAVPEEALAEEEEE